jgi:hypothetical protein
MPRTNQNRAGEEPVRRGLRPWPVIAISVVGVAALLTIAYVLFQWWGAYHFYSISSADVKDKLDSYKVCPPICQPRDYSINPKIMRNESRA